MNNLILDAITHFDHELINAERKKILDPLILYIQDKANKKKPIRLHFICTHNSRRSHLSQIWAQTMAFYFGLKDVVCYSGGTVATAMFPSIREALDAQGFDITKLTDTHNPVYAVSYDHNEHPVICFSKEYDHAFNPVSDYAAVITCDSADEACPVIVGAEARIAIKYEDPKAYDGTDQMMAKYQERSLQIASEMWYVFSKC